LASILGDAPFSSICNSRLTSYSGTANTLRYDCYDSDLDRLLLAPPADTLGNASDTALGQNLASAEVTAAQCLNTTADIGGLVGTAFVARDMARVVDALGEDGLLRYWGQFANNPD
jgi:hypothetical protein